jgi:hypothetical protein
MPSLGQREPDEHPDGEQRDQRLGVALEATSRAAARTASTMTPVAVHLPVGAQPEHVRQEVVLASRDASTGRPPNEVLAASASSTSGDELDRVEDDVVPSEASVSWASTVVGVRHHVELADQHPQAEQHPAEQDAEPHLGVLRPADPRLAELRHRVRDRLHPGQRRAAGGERLQQQQQMPTVSVEEPKVVVERDRGWPGSGRRRSPRRSPR